MMTKRNIPTLALFAAPLAALVIAAVPVRAQMENPEADQIPFIRVTGEASVATAPDEVVLEIGVTTQASTAQAAAAQNAQKVEAVMAVLRRQAGTGATIRTSHYALNPDYRPIRDENEPPTISSYTAYNMIQVRTKDLTRVGQIIDAAIGAGANTVQQVTFTVNEQNASRNQALTAATANAMAKAEAIAAGLKMRIKRILSVDESAGVIPYRGGYAGGRAMLESTTTIDPGAIDVRGMVTLTVEIGS